MSTAREEFEKEAAAFVQIIRDMAGAGAMAEAGQLLGQYKMLNPSDPQIAELERVIAGEPGAQNTDERIPGFLRDIESVYIVTGMTMKRTGVFTSIFGKIKLMEERLGYCSTILSCRHDIDFRKTEVWLKTFTGSQAILGSGTKIVSVYEYFQNSYAGGLENKAVYSRGGGVPEDGLRYEKISDKTYAVYDGDTRVRMDVYTGYSGSLRVERYYENDKAVREIYYDDWGYLNSVREFDPKNEHAYTAKYYTTAGDLCLEALFDKKKNEFEPYRIFLCGKDGSRTREFCSNDELAAYYLSLTIGEANKTNPDKFYLLVFESGTVSEIAATLDKDIANIAKVTIVHSIFLKDAYKPSSGPQMYYEYVCRHPAKFDGIVLLTRAARRDFTRMYGHYDSTFVIPHPYPYGIERVDFDRRDTKKAVVIARLFGEKQIEVMVDIFSAVVKTLPDVKLEIYGVGPDKEKIEARIKSRGMEENIFLMGYTDDAIAIYRTAVLSMMTSIAEGYGLVLMESICNGCPAFSHDIKYGPSEIIKDNETGFLFPRGDKAKFAKKIVEYFGDAELQRTMSENCYADAPRFSRDRFLESWLGMVETIYSRR